MRSREGKVDDVGDLMEKWTMIVVCGGGGDGDGTAGTWSFVGQGVVVGVVLLLSTTRSSS